MFMAHYLKMQRCLNTRDAIAAVKDVRPIALTADGWDQFAIEVLDACDAAG
jgi:protein-tyrosine phosphatase